MKGIFAYSQTRRFEKLLEVNDIFNVALRAKTDDDERYLLIRTIAGETETFEFGPVGDETCTDFSCRYHTFEVSEKSVKKAISAFVNSGDCEVEECEYEDALSMYESPKRMWTKRDTDDEE